VLGLAASIAFQAEGFVAIEIGEDLFVAPVVRAMFAPT
jgi:hypothetical protein